MVSHLFCTLCIIFYLKKAYPNPASSWTTMKIPKNFEIKQVTIYDLNGVIIKRFSPGKLFENTLDLSAFIPGFYLGEVATVDGANHSAVRD